MTDRLKSTSFFILLFIFEFLFINFYPYPGSFLVKLLPSIILVMWIFELKGIDRILLLIALAFCMAGDVFLDLDSDGLFIGGLVSFAFGHIAYVFFAARKIKISRFGILAASIITIYGVLLAYLLRVAPANLLIPVYIYLAIIIAMAAIALLSNLNPLYKVGACFFVLADSMLALDKFIVSIPGIMPVVIFIYFVAQYSIVRGAVISEEI